MLDQLKAKPAYLQFREALLLSEGKDVGQELERATTTLVEKRFEEQEIEAREALDFLLCGIRGKPVPAWAEIDVHGIKLLVKSITLNPSNRRLVFRQLKLSDFEHAFIPGVGIFTARAFHATSRLYIED